jgi:hypothetical protein
MAESKRSSAQPISDVSHPDKTPSSETSRPVIVRSGPVLKDPMIATAADTDEEKKPEVPMTQTAQVKLRPLGDSPQPEDKKSDEKAESTAEESKEKPTAKNEAEAADTEKPDTEVTQAGDAQGAQKSDAPDFDAEESKRAEHEAAIQKLADSKQFYLPINTVEKRKSKRFVAAGILLSLVLAIAWADVALDAGLVHIGNVKSVTHFFSN